jgi:cyclic 2,3-diphosphoglycerate synthetase
MKKDLEQFLPQADTLLTEVKASAIDVATRMALDQGLDVVYMDNIPQMLGGNIENLDKAIITLAEEVST